MSITAPARIPATYHGSITEAHGPCTVAPEPGTGRYTVFCDNGDVLRNARPASITVAWRCRWCDLPWIDVDCVSSPTGAHDHHDSTLDEILSRPVRPVILGHVSQNLVHPGCFGTDCFVRVLALAAGGDARTVVRCLSTGTVAHVAAASVRP